MPDTRPVLTHEAAADHVRVEIFDGGHERAAVGVELEWLTRRWASGSRPSHDLTRQVIDEIGPLPRGGVLTVEPGGQLEISSRPDTSIEQACADLATDLYVVDQACQASGIELVALGADPERSPERVVRAPRYRAMQAYFDQLGPAGRTMMCNTASIQVNVGLGPPERVQQRWRLANDIGPALIACFANSPFAEGRPTGWQSSRLRAWWMLDPTRSAPVPAGPDAATSWIDYALDARVMLIRSGTDDWQPICEALTFRQWIDHGHELGWPDLDDFRYHLSTLFPPVRPRGWFELRFFDALPTPFWHVAVAVASVLLLDDDAAAEAHAATRSSRTLWVDAAQLGLGHSALREAADALFAIALEALQRRPGHEASAEIVASYRERWVALGRCPADDLREAWQRDGSLLPPPSSPVPLPQHASTGRAPRGDSR